MTNKIEQFISLVLVGALDNAKDQNITGEDGIDFALDLLGYVCDDENCYVEFYEQYNDDYELEMTMNDFYVSQQTILTIMPTFRNDYDSVDNFISSHFPKRS